MSLIVKGEFGKLGQYIVHIVQSALKLIGASLGGLMQLLGITEEDVQKRTMGSGLAFDIFRLSVYNKHR